jgi:hypothetical protein
MVILAWLTYIKLKLIMSIVAVPLAAASSRAWRKVPGPESALLVTVNVAARSLSHEKNKISIKSNFRGHIPNQSPVKINISTRKLKLFISRLIMNG